MAQSIFSYRGGARSGSVSGQPTGLGGAPAGQAGQTFGQALRLQMQRPQQGPMVATGEQSAFATPQPKAAPTPATPSPAQGTQPMTPQPARAAPGVTTPMFKPSFSLPNTAFARYMQTQMTAPQQAVENTPVIPTIPGGAYASKSIAPVTSGSLEPVSTDRTSDASFGKEPGPAVVVNADGTVTVNGQTISDPLAKNEEELQSQKLIDESVQRARDLNDRAQQQIDANQILKALAAAGAQGVRGGMSGFGLGEQGEILQAANAAKLQAENVLQGSLSTAASQTAANEQASYDRAQALYDMNTEEGRAAFQRTQQMSDIAQQIAALQQDGLTDQETAQVQTLAQQYAELKAANDAAVASQTGSDDTGMTSDTYGGDIQSGVDVSKDPDAAKQKIDETTEAMKRYIIGLRSQFGKDLSDYSSVDEALPVINDLVSRAREGDPVSTRVLQNLGMGELVNSDYAGRDLRDTLDVAFDRIADTVLGDFIGEYNYFGQKYGNIPVPPEFSWAYKKAGQAPSADGT